MCSFTLHEYRLQGVPGVVGVPGVPGGNIDSQDSSAMARVLLLSDLLLAELFRGVLASFRLDDLSPSPSTTRRTCSKIKSTRTEMGN